MTQQYDECDPYCMAPFGSHHDRCPKIRHLVDTITVQQDIGGPYPVYKKVTLYLWSDGTVDWKPAEGVIYTN